MVNVQWKGTPACLDFQCECSDPEDAHEFHLDDVQFGKFTCPRCDRKWQLGQPSIEEWKP